MDVMSVRCSVISKKQYELEMARETHSNIKSLCGASELVIVPVRLRILVAITGL